MLTTLGKKITEARKRKKLNLEELGAIVGMSRSNLSIIERDGHKGGPDPSLVVIRMQQAPTALIDWKGADVWVQIDKAAVESIAAAVGTHVQACFTNERTHAEGIDALTTVGEVAAYDITTGWPA